LTILLTQPRQRCEFLSQTNELPVEQAAESSPLW
jgi:hypothetical protein